MTKVLVIATSRKTRGGITSVVKAHETGEQWKKYHCRWIETHRDKVFLWKLFYLAKGLLTFIIFLPTCKIVHIHTSEPPSAIRKCLFMRLAKLLHKKTIVHFHAFSPETTIKGKYQKVYRYLFKKADAIIVLSQSWKKYVNETFGFSDKIHVIYNPCTTEVFPQKYDKQKQILYAGTINARKGYRDLIEAFAKIASNYPDWKIVFAGNGEIIQAKKLAEELGIEKQTEFLGWISGMNKDRVFKESSIFCLPSYAEGFPMAVLDAWAYGLPVITTPVGGIPDIANDGVNLLLFNPGDTTLLTKQMEKLMVDRNLREKLSRASQELAKTMFNIETINKEIENLYSELLTR